MDPQRPAAAAPDSGIAGIERAPRRAGTASNRTIFRFIAAGLLLLIAGAAVFSYDLGLRLDASIAAFDRTRGAVEKGRTLLALAGELEWRRSALQRAAGRDDLQSYADTLADLAPVLQELRESLDGEPAMRQLAELMAATLAQQQAGAQRLLEAGSGAAAALDAALPASAVQTLRGSAQTLVEALARSNAAQRATLRRMVDQRSLSVYVTLALIAALSLLALVLGERHFEALHLREALQRTQRESEDKSSFLAYVSHELRTPMNTIFGFSGLLRDRLEDATAQRYLDAITRSARTLLALINDLLDLSRIEAGRLDLHELPTDLRELVDNVLALFWRQAQDKGVALLAEVPAVPPVLLDADRVRQMLLNLVSNALRYTDSGEIRVRVQLEPQPQRGGNRLQIEVADTGVGIAPAELERIFEPFVQGGGRPAGRGGSGLGLSITRQLARRMGGEIGVSSTPDAGSRFVITLPDVAWATAPAVPSLPAVASDVAAAAPPSPAPAAVLAELERLRREVWPRLSETLTMGEVRAFAAELERLAAGAVLPALQQYGRRLAGAAAAFDVAAVENLLADYPPLLAGLGRREDAPPPAVGEAA